MAVLGAGGAARAIVAGLRHYRAQVTVYNRTVSRAEALAREFACQAAGLADLPETPAEILINCTSVGMHPDVTACPLESIPPSVKVVFDTIYNPPRTRLLELASRAGCKTVSGAGDVRQPGRRAIPALDRPPRPHQRHAPRGAGQSWPPRLASL